MAKDGIIFPIKSRTIFPIPLPSHLGKTFPMAQTFLEALELLLKHKDVSLRSVCEGAGVSYEQIKKMRQNNGRTNVEDARKIARWAGMTLEEFIDDPEIRAPLEIVELYNGLSEPLKRELLGYGKGLAASQPRNQREADEDTE